MKIRKAKLEDCNSVYEISKIPELLTATGEECPVWYFESFVKEKQIFFIAEEKNKIIGYILGERITGNICIAHLMAVIPSYQNKGIGKKLLKSLEKECKKRKLTWVVLYGYENNPKTISFLVKNKYNKGALTREFNKKIE